MAQQLRIEGRMTVEECFELERRTGVRHDFVEGFAYPMDEEETGMVGASVNHLRICRNLNTALDLCLTPPCEVFCQALKLRIPEVPNEPGLGQAVYYPDLMVCCDPTDDADYWRERPSLVVEVASPSTEAFDRREKKRTYARVSTLEAYLIVLQGRIRVDVYRPPSSFDVETLGPDDTVRIESIGFEMPVQNIYDGVTF